MYQTQHGLAAVKAVGGVNIARQHQQQLVLLAEPVAQFDAKLGTVLPGVGQLLSVQAQGTATAVVQPQRAIGVRREVIGGKGLQPLQGLLLQAVAEIVVVVTVELGFQRGLQHPVFAYATGVVVEESGSPAVCSGGNIRVPGTVMPLR